MRPSRLKHVLAVLRLTAGIGQKELADRVGCSIATVQSVELGRLALSAKLCEKVVLATGVSGHWLMANNLKTPPCTPSGKPYTKQTFEAYLAERFAGKLPKGSDRVSILQYVKCMHLLLDFAERKGRRGICLMKLFKALDNIAVEETGSVAAKENLMLPMVFSQRLEKFTSVAELIAPFFERVASVPEGQVVPLADSKPRTKKEPVSNRLAPPTKKRQQSGQ